MIKTKLNARPEILIDWFDDFEGPNKYRFLSNFYLGEPIQWRGYGWTTGNGWTTGEHIFQAYKATTPEDFYFVYYAATPGESKRRGRAIELRPDWEQIKDGVMRKVVNLKFTPDREEGRLLLETGDALLVEGTFWHDRIWGVDLLAAPVKDSPHPDGYPGQNRLGILLMKRREELRKTA